MGLLHCLVRNAAAPVRRPPARGFCAVFAHLFRARARLKAKGLSVAPRIHGSAETSSRRDSPRGQGTERARVHARGVVTLTPSAPPRLPLIRGRPERCEHESKEHFSTARSIFSRLRRPCHARHVTASVTI